MATFKTLAEAEAIAKLLELEKVAYKHKVLKKSKEPYAILLLSKI